MKRVVKTPSSVDGMAVLWSVAISFADQTTAWVEMRAADGSNVEPWAQVELFCLYYAMMLHRLGSECAATDEVWRYFRRTLPTLVNRDGSVNRPDVLPSGVRLVLRGTATALKVSRAHVVRLDDGSRRMASDDSPDDVEYYVPLAIAVLLQALVRGLPDGELLMLASAVLHMQKFYVERPQLDAASVVIAPRFGLDQACASYRQDVANAGAVERLALTFGSSLKQGGHVFPVVLKSSVSACDLQTTLGGLVVFAFALVAKSGGIPLSAPAFRPALDQLYLAVAEQLALAYPEGTTVERICSRLCAEVRAFKSANNAGIGIQNQPFLYVSVGREILRRVKTAASEHDLSTLEDASELFARWCAEVEGAFAAVSDNSTG